MLLTRINIVRVACLFHDLKSLKAGHKFLESSSMFLSPDKVKIKEHDENPH